MSPAAEGGDLALALELLASQSTLVLATAGAGGEPHSTPLFYVTAGTLRLYWLSSPKSLHSRNLAQGGAAVAVFRPAQGWREIRGVQMKGKAKVVRGAREKAEVLERYRKRFGLGPEFAAVIVRSRLYSFEPSWLRYIDNSKGFRYRSEFQVG